MTLADPPPSMEFSIMDFFFEAFPNLINFIQLIHESTDSYKMFNSKYCLLGMLIH